MKVTRGVAEFALYLPHVNRQETHLDVICLCLGAATPLSVLTDPGTFRELNCGASQCLFKKNESGCLGKRHTGSLVDEKPKRNT